MSNLQSKYINQDSQKIDGHDSVEGKYSESDFRRISWKEYADDMEKVFKEVQKYVKKNNISIDAVVPIMRGGIFLASYLAYKFKLLRVLPIQYHYFFINKHKAELRQFLFTPQKDMFDYDPVFLLVEGDQCYGNTVIQASKDLKGVFPNCKILHATDCLDYAYRDSAKDYVDKVFYGRYTNNCEEVSEEECKKLRIGELTLAPWENADEEIDTMSGKQPFYIDLETIKNKSEKKQDFDF